MSELIVRPSKNDLNALTVNDERRIVAYFDHEFSELSSERVEHDIDEMVGVGFTNVVLCMTEKDIASRSRLDFLTDTVAHMQSRELEVWTDLWSVGGVFGGEGGSPFSDSGEKRCMCNPKLDTVLQGGLDAAASIGTNMIFWDEPEMKDCQRHQNREVEFLEKYTAAAGRLALKSAVCLCADETKAHQLSEVASLPDVIEIATDPYILKPFFNLEMTKENYIPYWQRWADATRLAAKNAGIDWHIWIPDFGVPKGRESMIDENVDALRERGVGSIAVWGFHGCASVPNFTKETDASPDELWQRIIAALARP